MTPRRPELEQVWAAIDLYLSRAYEKSPPSAVQNRLGTLRMLAGEDFWQSSALERDHPTVPTRYGLRLGNRFYPHMKMSIDAMPDGQGFLFRADCHDRHCCPQPNSREFDVFCQLMEKNQKIAESIETTWAEHDIPTFKSYLKLDLERRAGRSETFPPAYHAAK